MVCVMSLACHTGGQPFSTHLAHHFLTGWLNAKLSPSAVSTANIQTIPVASRSPWHLRLCWPLRQRYRHLCALGHARCPSKGPKPSNFKYPRSSPFANAWFSDLSQSKLPGAMADVSDQWKILCHQSYRITHLHTDCFTCSLVCSSFLAFACQRSMSTSPAASSCQKCLPAVIRLSCLHALAQFPACRLQTVTCRGGSYNCKIPGISACMLLSICLYRSRSLGLESAMTGFLNAMERNPIHVHPFQI